MGATTGATEVRLASAPPIVQRSSPDLRLAVRPRFGPGCMIILHR